MTPPSTLPTLPPLSALSPSRFRSLGLAALGCAAIAGPAAQAETALEPAPITTNAASPATPANPENTLTDAPPDPEGLAKWIADGKLDLNIRARYSYADIDGLDTANAETLRTRIGYVTGVYAGFQAAVQLEDNRAADYDEYNAAGLNGQPQLSVIADIEDTELNQAWLSYNFKELLGLDGEAEKALIKVGRQRIILDDARFIGNVGWRNLEQTFDAGAVNLTLGDKDSGVDLFYAYVNEVNRIFGPDSGRDFDSNSHLINASVKTPIGDLTGFAYLLDFDNAPAASSDTFGVRVENLRPFPGSDSDGLKLGYAASYAYQTDAGDNPIDYDANYVLGEVKLVTDTIFGGVGYELLSSDDGAVGFQTPLGTNHKFNGFADVFLNTPAVGLQDYYAFLGTKITTPFKGKFVVFYHEFESDEGGDDLGWEIDAVLVQKLTQNLTFLTKYAHYEGGDSAIADRDRLTVQLEFTF